MKDYFNTLERDVFLTFVKALDQAEKIIDTWGSRNNLSKEELKNLRTLRTYGYKFVESVLTRQNKDSKKAIRKLIHNSTIILDYTSMIKGLLKKRDSDISAASEDNEDYLNLVELIMHYNCCNCTKNCNSCLIYSEFESKNIPEYHIENDNNKCKYSYERKEDK